MKKQHKRLTQELRQSILRLVLMDVSKTQRIKALESIIQSASVPSPSLDLRQVSKAASDMLERVKAYSPKKRTKDNTK